MKLLPVVLAAMLLTGCQKTKQALFPGSEQYNRGTDPASVCRATPIKHGSLITSDSHVITTGETNGADGVSMSLLVCKSDPFCDTAGSTKDWGICGSTAACETVTTTGVAAGGVVVEFVANQVNVKMGQTNGYQTLQLTVNYSCN